MKLRVINTVLGYLILSFGLATVLTASIAYAPTDVVLTIVDNEFSSISYSTAMVIMHGIIAVLILVIVSITKINIKYSTIVLGFLGLSIVAYAIGFFKNIFYAKLFPNAYEFNIVIRLGMFFVGYIMTTIGAYLFSTRKLITPPYDLFPITVSEVTGKRMGNIRILFDTLFVIIAVLLLIITSDLSVIDDIISIFTFTAEVPLNIASIFMGVAFGYMFKLYERIPLLNK